MLRHFPRLFLSELRRYLRVYWSYRLDAVTWLLLWIFAFPLLMVTFDSVAGGYGLSGRQASLLGFLLWDWSMSVLQAGAGFVATESREGTLENVVLAPIPLAATTAFRILSSLLVMGGQTLLLGTVLAILMGIPLGISGTSILVVLLTLSGVGGLSLALGGLALRYKQIDSLVSIFTLLALVLTGALVPLNQLSGVYAILRVIMPTTLGIEALRATALNGANWSTFVADGTWLGLTIQTGLYIALGIVIFNRSFRHACRDGNLAAY